MSRNKRFHSLKNDQLNNCINFVFSVEKIVQIIIIFFPTKKWSIEYINLGFL
jgi:hypothetical protein